jgi:hypothetical protein
MMFGLYSKIAVAAAIALALAAGYWKAYTSGKQAVQLEWDAATAQATAAALAAEQAARAKEQELQGKADAIRRTKNAEIQSLSLRVDEYARRLQNRPDRPSSDNLPTPAGTGASTSGCTGAGLFRRDGEFLTGLAADADRLRIALSACQAAYKSVRP